MRILLAVVAAWLCACASFSTLKTARAIDQGTSQVAVSVGAIGVTLPKDAPSNGTRKDQVQVVPQFELSARYGIADGFDLGVKVWALGGEVNSTISLVRSASFDLALAPSVGLIDYSYTDSNNNTTQVVEVFGKLPLLFGLRFGPGNEDELVFGPEIIAVAVAAGDDYNNTYSTSGALAGGLIGISFKVNRWLRVMPELTVLTPISSFPTPSSYSTPGDQVIQHWGDPKSVFYQIALGFAWGDDGFEHPRYAPPPRDYYRPAPRYYAPPPNAYPPPPAAPYRGDE